MIKIFNTTFVLLGIFTLFQSKISHCKAHNEFYFVFIGKTSASATATTSTSSTTNTKTDPCIPLHCHQWTNFPISRRSKHTTTTKTATIKVLRTWRLCEINYCLIFAKSKTNTIGCCPVWSYLFFSFLDFYYSFHLKLCLTKTYWLVQCC